MSPTTDLAGARVLLTGATGGLGTPLARRLAAAGARLLLSARDPARLEAAAAHLRGGGAQVALFAGDLTTPDGPEAVVAAATAAFGGLDGLVHAAGAVAFGPVADTDDDLLDELLLVDFLAPVRLLRAALPALREGRGAFAVLLSGVVAERPAAGMAAYSAVKAAASTFARAAALELRREGVRVVDARPPHTETGLATRPLAGTAPRLPAGLDPDAVAERIVRAVTDGERDLPADAFGADGRPPRAAAGPAPTAPPG